MVRKTVLIAEFADEVKGFLDSSQKAGVDLSQLEVVSLQPEVRAFCQKRGLDHVHTLPFFDNDSHRRALMKSHTLTALIQQNLRFKVKPERENVILNAFIYHSRFYINHFLWLIEIMNGIVNKFHEHDFFVFRRNTQTEKRMFRADPFLSSQDRFLSPLFGKYGKEHGVKVDVIEEDGTDFGRKTRKNEIEIPRFWCTVLRKLYGIKLARISNRNTVFITAHSYNLDRLCRDVQKKFPGVLTVSDRTDPITTAGCLKLSLAELFNLISGKTFGNRMMQLPVRVFNRISKDFRLNSSRSIKASFEKFGSNVRQEFIYAGCNFWDEFSTKVQANLLKFLVDLWDTDSGQMSFLQHLQPNLVISAMSIGEHQNWAEASRSLDIPSVVVPQKMLLAPAEPAAKIEESYLGQAQVNDSNDNVASQSPLVTRYLEWAQYKGTILETGNLIFSKLDHQRRREKRKMLFPEIGAEKKIIVWAPSMKTRRSRRFYVLETADELLDSMKDVFEVIAQMEDVHLIFRIHPGKAFSKNEILTILPPPENITVNDSGPFEDILAVADLVLSFSSTSILESLMNHIPVLLYDKWNRYNALSACRMDGSGQQQVSSVYYAHETKNLSPSIRKILADHGNGNDHRDRFRDYVPEKRKINNFYDFVARCLNE
jgi:hypothetical protein